MLEAYVVFPTLVDTIVNVPINKRSDTAQLIYLSHFGSNAKNDNFPFFFLFGHVNPPIINSILAYFQKSFVNNSKML